MARLITVAEKPASMKFLFHMVECYRFWNLRRTTFPEAGISAITKFRAAKTGRNDRDYSAK